MESSFNAWNESFAFSQDMADLADAQARLSGMGDPFASPPGKLPGKDEAFLDNLSDKIAQRLGDHLAGTEVVTLYAKLDAMQQDNTRLATQIHELLAQLRLLEQDNIMLSQQLGRFRPLLGVIHVKV